MGLFTLFFCLGGAVLCRADATALPVITISAAATPEDEQLAASEGSLDAARIAARLTQRPADVLEAIPGFVASQHSGEGKANQYYLRGFNLDHGTDFALSVDGMPVNQPSHAHGQGYADVNFLIPELVERIAYRKGVYHVDAGDFSSAGSARIELKRTVSPEVSLGLGAHGYQRALVLAGGERGAWSWLAGVEQLSNDGPWQVRQGLDKRNGVLRASRREGDVQDSFTVMSYRARWRSTDQIPQRALLQGLVGRYGSLDPSDGGETSRHSLSWQRRIDGDVAQDWQAYAISSALGLRSNFTYFLDDPVNGDQFEQAESRLTTGGSGSFRWLAALPGGLEGERTAGIGWRHDRIAPVGLYPAKDGVRNGLVQESDVSQGSLGVFGSQALRLGQDWRLVAGLRGDLVTARVHGNVPENAGEETAMLASPKLSLAWQPTPDTTLFANAGRGFHSNDARGMTARLDPRSGQPLTPVSPLVRTGGMEAGLTRRLPGRGMLSAALWSMKLDSELVFSGDAGTTEAKGASHRQGLELSVWQDVGAWLKLEAAAAWSSARFDEPQGDPGQAGRHVPGAVSRVFSANLWWQHGNGWESVMRWRQIGPSPLEESGAIRSSGYDLVSLGLSRKWAGSLRASLEVFNLFNRAANDVEYFYVSRLPGEPAAGVADRHLHPHEPRQLRLTLACSL